MRHPARTTRRTQRRGSRPGPRFRTLAAIAAAAVAAAPLAVTPATGAESDVGADDPYGYLMVHFVEDSEGYAEKIHLSISRGDDPEHWDALNSGEPILASDDGTTGVRDPYLTRDPETGKYYIFATDLRVFGGDEADWAAWQDGYSTKLNVWESDDLVHWSDKRTLETTAGADGKARQSVTDTVTGKTISDFGMAWAPEATYVPNFFDLNDDGKVNDSDVDNPADEQGGAFVMYWSSKVTIDDETHTRVMWGATKDFSQDSYQFGGSFVDTGGDAIDTTMLQKKLEDGSLRSYRLTKSNGSDDKGIFMETTDEAAWWKTDDWTTTQTKIGAEFGNVEGPAGFTSHDGKTNYLYVDVIPPGYQPMVSTDLDAETPWKKLDSPDFTMPEHTKHGGIVPLTKGQYDEVRDSDASPTENKGATVDPVKVKEGTSQDSVARALKAGQATLTARSGQGKVKRSVTWDQEDLEKVDTSEAGTYKVSGVADTWGANLNHWSWKDAEGKTQDDEATDAWKLSGGSNAKPGARTLFSSTEIPVSATVTVEAEDATTPDPTPTDPETPGPGKTPSGTEGPQTPSDGSTAAQPAGTDGADTADAADAADDAAPTSTAVAAGAESGDADSDDSDDPARNSGKEHQDLAATGADGSTLGVVTVLALGLLTIGVAIIARRRAKH